MAKRADGPTSKPALLGVGAVVLIGLSLFCYWTVWSNCLKETSGHFTYALDDPYIHLSIARNFAFHGVWGVTPYGSSASSSSPLWVLLLTASIRSVGDPAYLPLILGIVFSIAATLVGYAGFVRTGLGVPLSAVAALLVFAAAPFHLLPFTGMEHSLQILLDLLFAFWILEKMGEPAVFRDLKVPFALAFLMCLCRYESMFLLVVPVGVSLWNRNWRMAAALALGGVCAVVGFGLFARWMGMPFLPNSLVLKGTVPKTFSIPWFQALVLHLRGHSFALFDLFVLCVGSGLVLRFTGLRQATAQLQVLLWTVVVACILHAGLAAIGIFYRYEAYLIVLTATVVLLCLYRFVTYKGAWEAIPLDQKQWLAALVVVVALQFLLAHVFWFYQLGLNLIIAAYAVGLYSLVAMETGPKTRARFLRSTAAPLLALSVYFSIHDRVVFSYADVTKGVKDIYLQQYQMSRFVARYYPSGRLVANDIGALTFYTHAHLLDLWGLASDRVRDLKVNHQWVSKNISAEVINFKPDVIVLYPQWFRNKHALSPAIMPVGSWTIPKVTSAGCPVVMFYALSAASASRIRSQMVEFQPLLPPEVTVRYGQDAVNHVPLF